MERGEVLRRIEVLAHTNPQSKESVELKHDLADLNELMKKIEHPYEAPFQNSTTKRGYDGRSDIFEIFEGPAQKDIDIWRKYNEKVDQVERDPTLSAEQKKDIKETLTRRLHSYLDENVPKQKPFSSLYRKDK